MDDDAIVKAAAGLLPLRAAVQTLPRHGLHIGRTFWANEECVHYDAASSK